MCVVWGASGDVWVGWEPQGICGWVGSLRGYVSGLGASEMYGVERCMGLMGSLRSYGAFGRAQEAFQNCKRITKLCSITVDHNRACQTYTAMPITTATVNDYSS